MCLLISGAEKANVFPDPVWDDISKQLWWWCCLKNYFWTVVGLVNLLASVDSIEG